LAEKFKTYKNETRDKINHIFKICEMRASDKVNPCTWLCKECKLSNEYEELSGIRIEDIDVDVE